MKLKRHVWYDETVKRDMYCQYDKDLTTERDVVENTSSHKRSSLTCAELDFEIPIMNNINILVDTVVQ